MAGELVRMKERMTRWHAWMDKNILNQFPEESEESDCVFLSWSSLPLPSLHFTVQLSLCCCFFFPSRPFVDSRTEPFTSFFVSAAASLFLIRPVPQHRVQQSPSSHPGSFFARDTWKPFLPLCSSQWHLERRSHSVGSQHCQQTNDRKEEDKYALDQCVCLWFLLLFIVFTVSCLSS